MYSRWNPKTTLNTQANDTLTHIGMPRRSGRYKWGSGKNGSNKGHVSGGIYLNTPAGSPKVSTPPPTHQSSPPKMSPWTPNMGGSAPKQTSTPTPTKSAPKVSLLDNASSIKSLVDMANTTSSTVKEMHSKKLSRQATKNAKKEASNLSTEELKARVARMGLEDQYTRLSSSRAEQGKDAVGSLLNLTTTALNVTSAALTVAVLMKQLSSKSPG